MFDMTEQLSNSYRPVLIYISAASDLMAEREALARMIATLPVTLSWRIVQSPLKAEPLDLDALQTADLHLLIMGGDIRAPVGLEWHWVQQSRGVSIPFLKQELARTPAGQAFVRQHRIAWRPFKDAADLSRQVQRLLAEHLLRHASRHALTPVEMEQLKALQTAEPALEQPTHGEGTGHSAVVLSRERFMPSTGILLDES